MLPRSIELVEDSSLDDVADDGWFTVCRCDADPSLVALVADLPKWVAELAKWVAELAKRVADCDSTVAANTLHRTTVREPLVAAVNAERTTLHAALVQIAVQEKYGKKWADSFFRKARPRKTREPIKSYLIDSLAQIVTFADTQVKAVVLAWPNVVDPQNLPDVLAAFTFPADRDKVRRALKGKWASRIGCLALGPGARHHEDPAGQQLYALAPA
ncbi:MAG: DUF4476 domain-containing protein [Myxococcales bacterium]|nr:DUF4476 domain-containing protein [Myxococcales bacterium]